MSRRGALLLGALAGVAACTGRRAADTGTGTLSVEWVSTDTALRGGTWQGRAEAGWCDAQHRLTVFAARGDTGAALLVTMPSLVPSDSIPLTAATDTTTAARATVAVRWPDERAVHALASGSGALRLDSAGPALAGRFEGVLALKDTGRAAPTVRGRFSGVPVAIGDAGCRLAGVGPAPGAGVP